MENFNKALSSMILVGLLSACSDPNVELAKEAKPLGSEFTFRAIFDEGQVCDDVKWTSIVDDRKRNIVTLQCDYEIPISSKDQELERQIGIIEKSGQRFLSEYKNVVNENGKRKVRVEGHLAQMHEMYNKERHYLIQSAKDRPFYETKLIEENKLDIEKARKRIEESNVKLESLRSQNYAVGTNEYEQAKWSIKSLEGEIEHQTRTIESSEADIARDQKVIENYEYIMATDVQSVDPAWLDSWFSKKIGSNNLKVSEHYNGIVSAIDQNKSIEPEYNKAVEDYVRLNSEVASGFYGEKVTNSLVVEMIVSGQTLQFRDLTLLVKGEKVNVSGLDGIVQNLMLDPLSDSTLDNWLDYSVRASSAAIGYVEFPFSCDMKSGVCAKAAL